MSEAKFTEGPWFANNHQWSGGDHWFIQLAKDDGVTVAAINTDCIMYSNGKEDANLIAAAPDMYKALKDEFASLSSWLVEYDGIPFEIRKQMATRVDAIDAVILKAEGK